MNIENLLEKIGYRKTIHLKL